MKVKNLLSRFQKIVEWSLVAKCAAFVGLVLYASLYGGFLRWVILVFYAFWFFYNEGSERKSYKYSYILYLVLIFLYGTHLQESLFAAFIFFICVLLLLSVWIGFTRFVFREKERTMDIYHSVLSFFTIMFALLFPGMLSALFAGVGVGILLFEHLNVYAFSWKSRMVLVSVALGLFVCELLLVTKMLSLHVVALTGVLTLIVLVIKNLIVAHFSGTLSREYLFQNIIIFVLLCILLFATGRWVI
ncbi:MAG: hypothetical protein LiPW41_583 [Parcubacteria group bacterium LiPW_41]|nr:MAG: hypothetical protein LiPW41_583 [Parcubacteria group bacterium LiPW_41]